MGLDKGDESHTYVILINHLRPEVLDVKSELSQGRSSTIKAWGDGLVRKVPLVQAEGPKFGPQTGTVAEVYSPSL